MKKLSFVVRQKPMPKAGAYLAFVLLLSILFSGAALADIPAPISTACPESIDIQFDKSYISTGEKLKITVKIYDRSGKLMPNKAFNIDAIKNNTILITNSTYSTDSSGIYTAVSHVGQETVGYWEFTASTADPGCGTASHNAFVTVFSSKNILRFDIDNNGILGPNDAPALKSAIFGGSCQEGKVCDVNGDGKVDAGDVSMLTLLAVEYKIKYDIDNNGVIGEGDYDMQGRVVAGLEKCPIGKICDVNEDGKVSTTDWVAIGNLVVEYGADLAVTYFNARNNPATADAPFTIFYGVINNGPTDVGEYRISVDFGDGSSTSEIVGVGMGAGKAAAGSVQHTYAREGVYTAKIKAVYAADFQLNNHQAEFTFSVAPLVTYPTTYVTARHILLGGTTLTTAKTPYSVDFGSGFNYVKSVCYEFIFAGNLLDQKETVLISVDSGNKSSSFGFTNVGLGSQSSRTVCLSPEDSLVGEFLDGKASGNIWMEGGSASVQSVDVKLEVSSKQDKIYITSGQYLTQKSGEEKIYVLDDKEYKTKLKIRVGEGDAPPVIAAFTINENNNTIELHVGLTRVLNDGTILRFHTYQFTNAGYVGTFSFTAKAKDSSCPARIDVTTDKTSYAAGDIATIGVYTYDSAGKLMASKIKAEFMNDGIIKNTGEGAVDSSGAYVSKGPMPEDYLGTNIYTVSSTGGCPHVSDSATFQVTDLRDSYVMKGGESKTVAIGAKSYTVTLVGVSDSKTAVIKVVSGQITTSEISIQKGTEWSFGELRIRVEDVFHMSSIDQTQNSAKLRITGTIEEPNPPDFPGGKTVDIPLSRGWNLITIPGRLERFEQTSCTEQNKLLGFIYLSDRREYVSLQKADEILGDSLDEYLAENAFWIYSYKGCTLKAKVTDYTPVISLREGWNLVPKAVVYYGTMEGQITSLNGQEKSTVYKGATAYEVEFIGVARLYCGSSECGKSARVKVTNKNTGAVETTSIPEGTGSKISDLWVRVKSISDLSLTDQTQNIAYLQIAVAGIIPCSFQEKYVWDAPQQKWIAASGMPDISRMYEGLLMKADRSCAVSGLSGSPSSSSSSSSGGSGSSGGSSEHGSAFAGQDISVRVQKVEKKPAENALRYYYDFSVLGNKDAMPNFNVRTEFVYPDGEVSTMNTPYEPADMACGKCPTQGGTFSLDPLRTGVYKLRLYADSGNTVAEINENNNIDSITFSWDGTRVSSGG